MTSHLQYLGPLHSHPHSLLGLSCCLLCFSHPHCHFVAARYICSAWVAFCSAWVALRSTCVAFCSAWPFAQLVRPFGKLVRLFGQPGGSLLSFCGPLMRLLSPGFCLPHCLLGFNLWPHEVTSGILCIFGPSLGFLHSPL